jgi:ATP-binding cassette subfamily F protein uup
MVSFLQIDNLTKSFGDRLIFGDISFGIAEGEKIGLIAKNGSGKSTLLRIIAGLESYDSGRVVFRNGLRVGYLEQLPQFASSLSVIDTCVYGDDDVSRAVRSYELALASGDDAAVTAASGVMDSLGAWDYEDLFKQILSQLKITQLNQPVGELSGGQVKRVALAKILLGNPELLILDEPTNHLDIEMIEWLENYLSRSRIALLMVTHDRYFLDRVCNKIIEIDQESIFTYNGNYNYYLEKREERLESQNAEVAKAKNLLRTELDWMRRMPQARGGKAKYRKDAFYELQKRAAQRREQRDLELNIKSSYIGSKIFDAHHVSMNFGDKVILRDFNYTFSRYEKLGIVGDNGVGKTTFLRLLLGEIAPSGGSFDIGDTVRFGYYSQQGITFDENKRVIDCISEIAEHVSFDEKTSYSASQFLQLFLFAPSDQQKLVAKLSGGERRRLYLATVLIHKPNFLILDEPTNDLDIVTLEVLEDYISRFRGCVIIVSHDRFFMDRTVDHIFVFHGNGEVQDFPGNYSEYRQWLSLKDEEEKPADEKSAKKQYSSSHSTKNRMTFAERREFESITAELDALNKEKSALESLFNSGTQIPDIAEKSARYDELKSIIDEKEFRWLELSEKNE